MLMFVLEMSYTMMELDVGKYSTISSGDSRNCCSLINVFLSGYCCCWMGTSI
ncbi:hypothetical protein LguiA_021043 [Lonicera macranthoides]